MKINADIMREVLYGGEASGFTIVEDQVTTHSRWSVSHKLIVKNHDKYYQASYSVGATEYQDERPWEYEKDVDLIEVKPVERTITVYEPIV